MRKTHLTLLSCALALVLQAGLPPGAACGDDNKAEVQAGINAKDLKFQALACAAAGETLHVVAVDGDGRLWHAFRKDGKWAAFLDAGKEAKAPR